MLVSYPLGMFAGMGAKEFSGYFSDSIVASILFGNVAAEFVRSAIEDSYLRKYDAPWIYGNVDFSQKAFDLFSGSFGNIVGTYLAQSYSPVVKSIAISAMGVLSQKSFDFLKAKVFEDEDSFLYSVRENIEVDKNHLVTLYYKNYGDLKELDDGFDIPSEITISFE